MHFLAHYILTTGLPSSAGTLMESTFGSLHYTSYLRSMRSVETCYRQHNVVETPGI